MTTANDSTTRNLRLLTTAGGMQLTYRNGQPCRLLDDVWSDNNGDPATGRVVGTDDALLLVFVDVRKGEGNRLPTRPAGGPGLPRGVQRWTPDLCERLTGAAQQQLVHDVRGSNWDKALQTVVEQVKRPRGSAPLRDTSGIGADDDVSRQPVQDGGPVRIPGRLHQTQIIGPARLAAAKFAALCKEATGEDADVVAQALAAWFEQRAKGAAQDVERNAQFVVGGDVSYAKQANEANDRMQAAAERAEYHRGVSSGKYAGYGWTIEDRDRDAIYARVEQIVAQANAGTCASN